MKKETIKEAVAVILPLVESQVDPDKPGIAGDMVEMMTFLHDKYGDMRIPGFYTIYGKIMNILLNGANDWLHHVQGCSKFSAYPNCTAINQHYFGKDSEEWHKTPTGRDCDKFEAGCLEEAARKVCTLLTAFA